MADENGFPVFAPASVMCGVCRVVLWQAGEIIPTWALVVIHTEDGRNVMTVNGEAFHACLVGSAEPRPAFTAATAAS